MLSLVRQVDILARLTERARAYFDLYKFVEGAEYRPKIVDQMNDYLGFFRFQGHILRYALIVELGALFEKKSDSVCLFAVLKRAQASMPNAVHLSLAQKLGDASAHSAKKISDLRNKAFAHRDARMDFDEVFAKAAITLNEIEELIGISRDIVDELCEQFDAPKPHFTTEYTVTDTIRLFQALGSEIECITQYN